MIWKLRPVWFAESAGAVPPGGAASGPAAYNPKNGPKSGNAAGGIIFG
jgi:hypothetical protein